ncbi:MAG: ABC transporter permease [Armatimonadetes bacterium]|nr:ABC transporter permease [Armatimonadota bacterium]
MQRYLVRRMIQMIPVLLGVSLAVFLMLHALPVDPVRMLAMETTTGTAPTTEVSEEVYNNLRRQLGLDRPLPEQFVRFVWKALHGDLGKSFRNNRAVGEMLHEQLPWTVRLTFAGLGVSLLLGITLGVAAGLRPNSWLDTTSMAVAMFGVSMPIFWLGLMLIYVFSLWLNLLPSVGTGPESIILPAVALGFHASAIIARLTRSSLLEVMESEYVRTARAKGLVDRAVVLHHALKNALIPVITVVGLQFGALLSGAVVTETVFARPGVGRLAVQGIIERDFPLVQGFVLLAGVSYAFSNLLVDLVYAVIDPRIRYER